jgi:ZIP family zinc transporter
MENNVLFALGLTLFAGLSAGIGSLIGFMSKEFNPRLLTIALGFSAGVMIYVSMIEIFVKARDSLTVNFSDKMGCVWTVVAFFAAVAGIMVYISLDEHRSSRKRLLPVMKVS